MAYICMLFPAIVFCFVRNQLMGRKVTMKYVDIKNNVFEYLCGSVLINFIIIALRFLILHKSDNIINILNTYSGFAIKYLAVSVILAVVIPNAEMYVKQNICFSFDYNFKINPLSNKVKDSIVYFYGLIAALHHLIRIFDNSFWGDEGLVVNAARKTWGEMLKYVAGNGHSPLHYAFARICSNLFGESGIVFHLSATFPYFIIIFVTIILVRKWFGNKVAIILITFSTFLNNAVIYNLEIRMYVWCELFVLMTYLMVYKLIKVRKNIFYIFMSLASIGAVYSHYFALANVGLLYSIILIYIVKTEKKSIWKVFVSGVSVLAALTPWLLFVKRTKGVIMSNYHIGQVSWADSIDFIFYSKYSKVLLICCFLSLTAAMIYDLGIVSIRKDKKGKKNITLKFVISEMRLNSEWVWIAGGLTAVFGTILAAEIISHLMYPIIVLRYLYVSYIIMWLLFAVGISKCRWSHLWTIGLVAFVLATCYPFYINTLLTERTNNKRLEKTLEVTQPKIDENDIIYTDIVHFAWTVGKVYYPNTENRLFGHAEWWGESELPELDSGTEYWLFLSGPVPETVLNNLSSQNCRADMVVENGYIGTGNVWIYRILNKNERVE